MHPFFQVMLAAYVLLLCVLFEHVLNWMMLSKHTLI